MNRLIASAAAALIMTAAVTAYAQNAPKKLMWCMLYPPVGCADTETVTGDKDIIVKFKIAEIYEALKNGIS